MPFASAEDWVDSNAAIDALYHAVEDKAISTIDWYFSVKRSKKRASRFLRAAAIVLGVAGALVPVAVAPWTELRQVQWGYVLLGLAAGCVAFDRFFGISTGWMRCVRTAQALQSALEDFQYGWAATYVDGSGLDQRPARLAMLRDFSSQVTGLIRGETTEWELEFHANLTRLDDQTGHDQAKSSRDTGRSAKANGQSLTGEAGHQ